MTANLSNHRHAEFEIARFAESSHGSTAARFGKLWRVAESGALYPSAVLAADHRWAVVEETENVVELSDR